MKLLLASYGSFGLVLIFVASGVLAQTCREELNKCKSAALSGDFQEPCANLAGWVHCVSNTSEVCDLDESNGVTFEAINKEAKRSCDASSPLLMTGWDTCRKMMECIAVKTRFWDLMPNSQKDILNDTISTEFWCGVMIDPEERCIVPHAESCKLPKGQITVIEEQLVRSNAVCKRSVGNGTGTKRENALLSTVLFLSTAAVIARIIH